MKIAYINENRGFIRKKDAFADEEYDVRSIMMQMMGVRTAKDFLQLLNDVPLSFFLRFSFPLEDRESTIDLVPYQGEHFYKGSIENAVQKYYLDIDYLDGFLLREGVLGPLVIEEIDLCDGTTCIREALMPNEEYEYIHLSTIESLISNVQRLASLAAIAGKDDVDGFFDRQLIYGDTAACVVKSGLSATSDFNSDYKQDSLLRCLFADDEIQAISKHVKALGYAIYSGDIHGNSDIQDKPFVVREEMSDSEIAGAIFSWFMNSLFEGSAEPYYSGNTFKVSFCNGVFRVYAPRSPIRELYYELAKLAEAGSIKLCACCGRAFVDCKSRGNGALYCSRSCNTKASNKRKDLAKQYKAAGIAVEKAIKRIGSKYEKSIRAWYQ